MINVFVWIHRRRTVTSSYKKDFYVEMIRCFEAIVCIETSKFDCEVEFPVAVIMMNTMSTFLSLFSKVTLLFHPLWCAAAKPSKVWAQKGLVIEVLQYFWETLSIHHRVIKGIHNIQSRVLKAKVTLTLK